MIRVKGFAVLLICFAISILSCVKHEVSFTARSDVSDDGSIYRKGSMAIQISGDRDMGEDSLKATEFFESNYIMPDENMFDISRVCRDSVLIISWEGRIDPGGGSVSDYIHKSKDGPNAINRISIVVKNRWIFRDVIYRETFSDPVDTTQYFPLIQSRLSGASEFILRHEALKGIRDNDEARELLSGIEKEAGLDLFRGILADPAGFDTLATIYDSYISIVADSLAGFAGVKQNPDSLDRLIHNVYDAAWDTLLSDHPGLFGSFAIDDIDIHNFRVEVAVPGCLTGSNSDSTLNGVSIWTFNRMDFFAREYTIDIAARQWRWLNVALTLLVIAVILFFGLRPVRRSGAS